MSVFPAPAGGAPSLGSLAQQAMSMLGGAPTTPVEAMGGVAGLPPDPYADQDAIKTRVRDRMQLWKHGRDAMMRTAWRNILFYRGHQWIVYDYRLGNWRPAALKRNTPRAVTNRYASTMDAYCSVLARVEPTLNFRPATDDPEDLATANVADRVMEIVANEIDIRLQRQILAVWAGFTGGAWLEAGYDPSPDHGVRLVQHEQCATCGIQQPPTDSQACLAPGCGGPMAPAMDPTTGQPIGHEAPIGKMYADIATCFEMFYDTSVSNFSLAHDCARKKSISVDEAKRRWPDFADQIHADSAANTGELYQERLPLLAGAVEEVGGGFGRTWPFNQGVMTASRVTETWYWCLPEESYPDGLLAIIVGTELLVYVGPLAYFDSRPDGTKDYFLPLVHFPTKLVPGSAWPKTVADDLALKQVQRNRLESLIEAILNRTANPVWLVPAGANVTQFTGDPGQVITWNALGPSPHPPARVAGQGIPTGLISWMQMIDHDFEELAATFDVMKGDRPAGVSAGVALQMLQERAMSRFGPMFILWEQAWAKFGRMALAIFRQFATEPRLLKIKGRNGQWEISKFMAADLTGRVDVVPEAGSGMPKSTLVERAAIEQAINMGAINIRDPEIQQKVLELYDLSMLTPGMARDTKMAVMQCDQVSMLALNPQAVQIIQGALAAAQQISQQAGQPVPYDMIVQFCGQQGVPLPRIRPTVDGHVTFALEIGNFLKSEFALGLPMPLQQILEMKHTEHTRLFQQAQGQPPPKVQVGLRGDLSPDQAAQLAGVAPAGSAQQGQDQRAQAQTKGSSLLDTPAVVQRPPRRRTTPTLGASSPAAMAGRAGAMGQTLGA